ncbi:hypothetical protein M5K25_023309 [Dendrobium thyrsiflorum]|uniref:Uncharacterized protein n=1 Tax=Dendrobium thyrsiflorum TaxID=117978 RepID=A0ABD0U7N8_DENTH
MFVCFSSFNRRMVGEWMMDPIKIPWFRRPGPSWSLVYLVRGGSRPNLTEGSLSAAMGCFVQGYLVDLGWRAPSHNRLSCGAIWRQNRRLEDTYHVLTGKRISSSSSNHPNFVRVPCFSENFGSLPASPPFRGKTKKLAFPSSPRGRFSVGPSGGGPAKFRRWSRRSKGARAVFDLSLDLFKLWLWVPFQGNSVCNAARVLFEDSSKEEHPTLPKLELPPLPEFPKPELPPLPDIPHELPKLEFPPLPEIPHDFPKPEFPHLPEIPHELPKPELPPLPEIPHELPKPELPPLPEISHELPKPELPEIPHLQPEEPHHP